MMKKTITSQVLARLITLFILATGSFLLAVTAQADEFETITLTYSVEFEAPIEILADEPVGDDGGIDKNGNPVTNRPFFYQRRIVTDVIDKHLLTRASYAALDYEKHADGTLVEGIKVINIDCFENALRLTLLERGVDAQDNQISDRSAYPPNARKLMTKRAVFAASNMANRWVVTGRRDADGNWVCEVHMKPLTVEIQYRKGEELKLQSPKVFELVDGTKVRVTQLKKLSE